MENENQDEQGGSGGNKSVFPSKAKRALVQIMQMMEAKGLLNSDDISQLMTLVENRNQVIFAAFEAFEADQDLDELVDTLQLVANYSSEQAQSMSSVGGARTLSSSAEGVGDASEELLELIEALETDAKLSSIEASALAKMVHLGDEYVMAAHDVYVSDQDVDDLIDTLQRIAKREVKATNNVAENHEPNENDDDDDEEEAVQRMRHLKLLFQDGLLGSEETRALMRLAEDEDPKLMAAFDVFDSINDQEDLLDSLKRLLIVMSSDQNPDSADKEDSTTVEEQFLQIASEMHLSPSETTALRNCLANEDTLVKAAQRVYQLEQDAEDLKDTLQRVARFQVESQNESESGYGEESLCGVGSRLLERGRLSSVAIKKLEQLHLDGDVVVSAALDVFRIDGDVEELEDTLMRVVENL
jgi:hypothetical protein